MFDQRLGEPRYGEGARPRYLGHQPAQAERRPIDPCSGHVCRPDRQRCSWGDDEAPLPFSLAHRPEFPYVAVLLYVLHPF